ncbi:T-complex protein 1, theta subunit [Fonticula alba]|uniref:CCT-theta n=1 Tax=Fonticula alba TaxID=691883 RepID=A0A058Z7H1_FONAL|nr:T-complex protein 1, theta subunit [Fonticula alba]KCV69873.1 T-complex protein 1, theta subunit [Fonticula alba]|eukprot:XP_009495479.1 T-complex protein 1, theta subunit [Fonticula alba]
MAMRIPKSGLSELLKDGYKHHQGLEEAVLRNIRACRELSAVTRTSLGPNGKNKLIVNNLEKLFITNDAATIIQEMDVIHPAAKLIVMATEQQRKEVGDGSNLVCVLAGEFLNQADELLRMGLHATDITEAYSRASKKALELLETLVVKKDIDVTDRDGLIAAVKSSISSKQYGNEDFLSALVVDACMAVLPKVPANFNVDNVRTIKIMGSSLNNSTFVRGMVIDRQPDSTIKKATNAKVAVFTCPLDISRTETKGTVLIHNSEDLMKFSRDEEAQLEGAIKEIADAGIKVLVTGSSIGELALHYINRYNLIAVKVLSKFDLRRLCRSVGAVALSRLGAPTVDEAGHCDVVETIEIGSDRVTVFRQNDSGSALSTIVIRGSTRNYMDDVERSLNDAINTFRTIVRDPRLLPGAGATEMELSRLLGELGDTIPGVEQYGVKQFAEAFEVIPRTLADNAGLDATVILAKLGAAHRKGESSAGVDIETEDASLLDATAANIFDTFSSKYWAIKYAADVAMTVLKVDQIIMSKPAGGPKPRENGNWDED